MKPLKEWNFEVYLALIIGISLALGAGIQGIVGVRSDAELTSRVLPIAVSTYGDELFTLYEMDDLYDGRSFTEDPYLQSWGYGNLAATTYVGGRDRTELLHSIVSLGDRTWLRVEINNNSGLPLTNVSLTPLPPAGITAVPDLFAQPLLQRGELRRVLPDWCLPSHTAWAVFPGRKLMPAKTRVFIDMLEAALRTP